MKKLTLILICFCVSFSAIAKKDAKESTIKTKKDSVKTGFTFGVLPSVAFDADLGFQGGILGNVYYYGDGSTYPDYLHSLYVEAAYTTKHYGILRVFYDTPYLIKNHRLTVDVSYLPDSMCDFFGYNGYQSVYVHSWKDSKAKDLSNYASRAFYKYKRNLFRTAIDIQGDIHNALKWNAGLGVLGYNVGEVDLDMLNGKKAEEKKLPDITGLYERYRQWGLIKENEANGGWHPYIHAGITFDTRDKRANPNKGIHTDAFFTYSAAFGNQSEYNNLRFNFTFRHYIPLYRDRITFAYRLGTQNVIAGKSPFYANTYLNTLFLQRVLYEGLGGGNSLRGIMRNRINADGYAYANVEFRFKVVNFKIGRQYFYIGLNPFVDCGMVTQGFDFNAIEGGVEQLKINVENTLSPVSERQIYLGNSVDAKSQFSDFFNLEPSLVYKPHFSAGCGLKIAMNENFILSVDWAAPLNKQDNGKISNLYIKMGYLF